MRAQIGGFLRSRPVVGIAASIVLHLLLVLALLFLGMPGRRAQVKRGEPLFVELPKLEEPAPRGNPAAREPGPPAPAPAPAPPSRPSEPSRPAPPVVAKAPPAPSPKSPASPPAKAPAREPDRVAAAKPPEPSPAPPPPKVADSAPAPPEAPKAAPAPTASPPAPSAPKAAQAEPGADDSATQPARPSSGDTRVARAPSPGSSSAPDLRSALRRGGGAGGAGNGRGGIEGEPIPLDSKDPRYSDYLDRIRRMIKEKWGYPCVKNAGTHECEYKTALLVIEFGIAKDGWVPFVNVLRTSGYQIYDDYAVNAIKFAQPFPRVPDTMGGPKGLPIVATFSYTVDTSLVNLLR